MYAKRNPRVALNNQLLFMLCQRTDGRLPGRAGLYGSRKRTFRLEKRPCL